MKLDRQGREYYGLSIVTDPPVVGWQASFDDGLTYVTGNTTDGVTRWLVAGPEVDQDDSPHPDGTVILARDTNPKIRHADTPEVVVRLAPVIVLI